MKCYIFRKIPPHFKGITLVRSEFSLQPSVQTDTHTHRANISLRIAHRLLALVVSQFIASATTTAHLDLAVETRKWFLWNSDGSPFQVWTLVMTVLPSERNNEQSPASSNSTRHIAITNTCHDSPNLTGVWEDQKSKNRKHVSQWQYDTELGYNTDTTVLATNETCTNEGDKTSIKNTEITKINQRNGCKNKPIKKNRTKSLEYVCSA
jgi:hypothetical protein